MLLEFLRLKSSFFGYIAVEPERKFLRRCQTNYFFVPFEVYILGVQISSAFLRAYGDFQVHKNH